MIKKYVKSIFAVCVFLQLLLQGLEYCSEVLLWKTSADINLFNGKHFYENEENIIDVMSYGSSHCFCTINNAILYDEYGIASYNFAAGSQRIGNTYYFIKESLKYQKPKVMLVELYTVIEQKLTEGDVYRNTLALKLGKNYYENIKYINSIAGEVAGEISDLVLQWPVIHTRYAELEEEDYIDFHYFQRGYRAAFSSNVYEIPEGNTEKGTAILSEDVIYYLEQIIALAEDADIELVFYVAPYVVEREEQKIYNAIDLFLGEKDVTFLNFTTEENIAGIDYTIDMWDSAHLNVWGAEKVTNYLGEYLKKNIELLDRRGDEKYWLWEMDSDYFKRLKQENALKNSLDLDSFLSNLKTMDNLCVITLDGKESWCASVRKFLADIGIAESVVEENDVFVFCEGELAAAMKKEDGRYYGEYQKKALVITYQEVFTVNIGKPLTAVVSEGTNIYVYNELDGVLVETVGVTTDGSLVR